VEPGEFGVAVAISVAVGMAAAKWLKVDYSMAYLASLTALVTAALVRNKRRG